jgi:hypothetical protein
VKIVSDDKEKFKERSWLVDDLAYPRRAQESTSFIIEINDPPVQTELRQFGRNGTWNELFAPPKRYTDAYVYNLQRGTVRNYKSKDCEKLNWDNPIAELDNALASTSCTVIVEYVYLQSHVDAISDFIAAVAQDGSVYGTGSTLMVETSSIGLFDPTLRKLCHAVTVPASSEAERWQIGTKLATELHAKLATRARQLLEEAKITEEDYNLRVRRAAALEFTQEYLKASRGLNSGQLQTALQLGVFKRHAFSLEDITSVKIDMMKAQGITYEESKLTFANIGGYSIWKELYLNSIARPLSNPDRAAYYGVEPPRGIIEYGPAGTGNSVNFIKALTLPEKPCLRRL